MDLYRDFALARLKTAPAPLAGGTTLTLDDASVFPAAPFFLTLWPHGGEPGLENSETVRVTAVSGNTLTVVRGQEGTSVKKLWPGFDAAQLPTSSFYQSIADGATAQAVAQAVPLAVAQAVAQATVISGVETEDAIQQLFDFGNTLPEPLGTAAAGTEQQVSRRDHVHTMPTLDGVAAPTDVTTLNASTTAHGLLLKATAPAAGLQNVVAIRNGETVYVNRALFDTTNATALGTAAPGTSLVAARQDHVHTLPKLDDAAAPDDNTDLNASTTAHGLVLKATAPAAGLRNVVCIDNAETAYKNGALFDATAPADIGTAAAGTQLVAARRDHVHALPTNVAVVGNFGCNGQSAQAAYPYSGVALAGYVAGANGLDSGANMAALHQLVVDMRAALKAAGITV